MMRKLIVSIILLVLSSFLLIACNLDDGNAYKLEVIDNYNLLMHPLEKEYEGGSTIIVHLGFKSGSTVGIKINDEIIISNDYSSSCENLCSIVGFIMPNEDTIIYTYQNEDIVKCGEDDNHQYDEGKVDTTSSVTPSPIIFTCELCGYKKIVEQELELDSTGINTQANFTFFSNKKSDLNKEELKVAYESYIIEQNWNSSSLGDYEIYNFASEEINKKYNLDIFQVYYSESSYYFIKHNDSVYQISPFSLDNVNSNCINHIAITDINNDGYIEVLTAINCFKDRGYSYYCVSFVKVIDTKTKHSVYMSNYNNINYFKENEEGIISIYDTNGIMPVVDDLHDGILDEKYYDLATNLYDIPKLNTANYEFKERYVEASCDLFKVEVTINEDSIKFPYLFNSYFTSPTFKINVKMEYLGETFKYTSPNAYLDGATVSFINDHNSINCEDWMAATVITEFVVYNGMVIEREYRYHESSNFINKVGIYDMVITYENEKTNIKESIVIEDFLQLIR